jgi:primosomal protein N' (replication factor Y) (superfamily II helicase)
MIRLVVRGPVEAPARESAVHLGERLRKHAGLIGAGDVRVLGPGTAPIARLRGEHRFQLQLQGPDMAVLRAVVADALKGFTPPSEVFCSVDVDPWDMQ